MFSFLHPGQGDGGMILPVSRMYARCARMLCTPFPQRDIISGVTIELVQVSWNQVRRSKQDLSDREFIVRLYHKDFLSVQVVPVPVCFTPQFHQDSTPTVCECHDFTTKKDVHSSN